MAELARGREPRYPLSTVQAYLDWKRFKIPPYTGGTRSWPALFLEEWRLIHDTLRLAELVEAQDGAAAIEDDE